MRFIKHSPIAFAVSVALAATTQISTTYSQEEEAMLEEVMVTARKRQESLSEIPIAITAITAEGYSSVCF